MSEKVNGITVSVTVGDGGSAGLDIDVTGSVAGMSEGEVKKYVDERIEAAFAALPTWEGGSY